MQSQVQIPQLDSFRSANIDLPDHQYYDVLAPALWYEATDNIDLPDHQYYDALAPALWYKATANIDIPTHQYYDALAPALWYEAAANFDLPAHQYYYTLAPSLCYEETTNITISLHQHNDIGSASDIEILGHHYCDLKPFCYLSTSIVCDVKPMSILRYRTTISIIYNQHFDNLA